MSIGSLPYPKAFSLSLSSAHKQKRTYLHFRCLIRMSGRKLQNNNNHHIYFAYLQTSSSCSNRDFNINQFTLSYLCRRYIANQFSYLSFQSESSINHVKSSRNSAKTNRSLKCAQFFFTHWNYFGKIISLSSTFAFDFSRCCDKYSHTHSQSHTNTFRIHINFPNRIGTGHFTMHCNSRSFYANKILQMCDSEAHNQIKSRKNCIYQERNFNLFEWKKKRCKSDDF